MKVIKNNLHIKRLSVKGIILFIYLCISCAIAQEKGCLLSYSIAVRNNAEYLAVRYYGNKVGSYYPRHKNFTKGITEQYENFTARIQKPLVDFIKSCQKIDILVLGHGCDANNYIISNILNTNNKIYLAKRIRLVFSSGCGDGGSGQDIDFWRKYATTFIASKDTNMATATMIFMKNWTQHSLTARQSMNAANQSYFGNREWSKNDDYRTSLSLWGNGDINIFSPK